MINRNQPTIRPEDTPLSPAEIGVLEACQEVVTRQNEVLPLLAKAVGVSEDQVFYTWAFRRCKQSGRIDETGWSYFFHGLECDLKHADGRFLRFDFGPKGRLDTFTAWGVLQFIMTSAPPWSEFPDLKREFADREPPYNQYAGSMTKIGVVWDALKTRGAFEPVAPELVAFQASHTTRGPDGLSYIRFPPGTPEEMQVDCSVAHRLVFSEIGHRLLESHSVSHSA